MSELKINTMRNGTILTMSNGKNEIKVEVVSTKHLNCVEVRPLAGAITFKKVSLKGKAFRSDFKVIATNSPYLIDKF